MKKKKNSTNKKDGQISVNFEDTPPPSPPSSVSSFHSTCTHEDDYEDDDGKLPNTLAKLLDRVAVSCTWGKERFYPRDKDFIL